MQIFIKIKKCDRRSADRLTYRLKDASYFVICPCYAIAMRQIINAVITGCAVAAALL